MENIFIYFFQLWFFRKEWTGFARTSERIEINTTEKCSNRFQHLLEEDVRAKHLVHRLMQMLIFIFAFLVS